MGDYNLYIQLHDEQVNKAIKKLQDAFKGIEIKVGKTQSAVFAGQGEKEPKKLKSQFAMLKESMNKLDTVMQIGGRVKSMDIRKLKKDGDSKSKSLFGINEEKKEAHETKEGMFEKLDGVKSGIFNVVDKLNPLTGILICSGRYFGSLNRVKWSIRGDATIMATGILTYL